MSQITELALAYRQLFKSAVGKDLLNRLDALHASQLKQATKADKETAWGLLNKADGIDLVRLEIKKVQALDQKGAGRS